MYWLCTAVPKACSNMVPQSSINAGILDADQKYAFFFNSFGTLSELMAQLEMLIWHTKAFQIGTDNNHQIKVLNHLLCGHFKYRKAQSSDKVTAFFLQSLERIVMQSLALQRTTPKRALLQSAKAFSLFLVPFFKSMLLFAPSLKYNYQIVGY